MEWCWMTLGKANDPLKCIKYFVLDCFPLCVLNKNLCCVLWLNWYLDTSAFFRKDKFKGEKDGFRGEHLICCCWTASLLFEQTTKVLWFGLGNWWWIIYTTRDDSESSCGMLQLHFLLCKRWNHFWRHGWPTCMLEAIRCDVSLTQIPFLPFSRLQF